MKRVLVLAACVALAGCRREAPPPKAARAAPAAVATNAAATAPATASEVALPKVTVPEQAAAKGNLDAALEKVLTLEANAQFAEAAKQARDLRQEFRSDPEVGKIDQLLQRLNQEKNESVNLPMLVENLGSSNSTDRAVARSRLAGSGEIGRVFLRKAVRESSSEVAANAAKLLADLRDAQTAETALDRLGREPAWIEYDPAAQAVCAVADKIPSNQVAGLYASMRDDAQFKRKGAVPALGRVFQTTAKGSAAGLDTLAGDPAAYSNLMAYTDRAYASTNPALCLWACQDALPFGAFRRDPFYARNPILRSVLLRERGGGSQTEEAVVRALDWFQRTQEQDGHWNMQRFNGGANRDVAGTAFALMCFTAFGAKESAPGKYQATVSNAVNWLVAQCKPNGDVRGAGTMYDQGFATLALADVYGMTHDARVLGAATSAVQFIVSAQNRDTGGWRYNPGEAGDTSCFSAQIVALRIADLVGLTVPDQTLKLANKWLDSVAGGENGGQYGYTDGKSVSPTMTAAGMVCRQFLGMSYDDPKMLDGARYVAGTVPSYDNANYYFWYYATQALFHQGGVNWEAWNTCLKQELLIGQIRTGGDAGTWEPAGPWSDQCGRVVSTAIATLCLEVYYRYPMRHDFSLRPLIEEK